MEEVRIYRIVWKNILAAIVCLALTAFGIIEAINTNDGAGKATVGLFFGFIGLFALYQTVKVRRRPYLTITDKCLIESRTDRSLPDYTIHFAEVDHLSIDLYSHFAICPATQDGMTKRYGEALVFPQTVQRINHTLA